ncbi:MAG: hypothetical protein AAB383_04620 [Patescibacteria group bacterium]
MSLSPDVAAEKYFDKFGLSAHPIVPYERLHEVEKLEWPHGFGLEVKGVKEQIDDVLISGASDSDPDRELPSADYFKALQHWGCINLKGSWGEDFFIRKSCLKARDDRYAIREYRPEEHASAFRFHKDPSAILASNFYEGDNRSLLGRLSANERSETLTLIGALLVHPAWASGTNFWSPMQERRQANTLLVPEQSFKRALNKYLPEHVQEIIDERSGLIFSILENEALHRAMVDSLHQFKILDQKTTHLSIDEDELKRRLLIDYYSNFMTTDRSKALVRNPRTPQGKLDSKITKDCSTRVVIDYSEPSIATWWEGLVMHKGSPTGVKAPPLATTGLTYDYKTGFYI